MAEPAPVSPQHRDGPLVPALRLLDGGPEPAAAEVEDRRLEVPAYSHAAALRLRRELAIGHVLAQVLVRRGLADPDDARAFLAATDRHDPARLPGIAAACELIASRIAAGTRITVHGDYDVDGVCATAIMVRALRCLGATVDWFIPGRLQDGYGLSSATVQRLAARGTGLIVCVDCAITAVEEVAGARAAGLDVIVCDHHSPRADGALPDCPIVHPALGDYPCPDLCGAAVSHKLAEALGARSAGDDAELVAMATIADLVPLRGENRRIVRDGLRALASTVRPGLRALMAVARVDPSALDAGAVAFRLAPRINAAGRLRRADAGLELLLCDDPARARAIATELDAVNAERRAVEQRILWEAEAQIRELDPDHTAHAYVLAGEDWHPGVVGIVASRIVERHHRPSILIGLPGGSPPAEGAARALGAGSGRSIPGFDLLAVLHATAEHLERYGGHRAAAGLSIAPEAVTGFRVAVEAHAAAVLTPDLLEPVERVDAVVSGSDLGLELAEELEALEPCGMANASPRLLIPGGRVQDIRSMGEGRHARFTLHSGGARARAVSFGCGGRVARDVHGPLDATFRLERNVFNGAVEPRLVLRHARPCAPGAIEVLDPEWSMAGVLAEVDAPPPVDGRREAHPGEGRTILDRRGHSPLTVLVDAVAGGAPVLAVCADVRRRVEGLRSRVGQFALISWDELERRPEQAAARAHLVALDPPACATANGLLRAGDGIAQLAWGPAELRFAEQMHELEYGLRASLVTLYRALAARGRVAGEELERLLRGDGSPGRSARLAGRLIRVLAELELVSLDRASPALEIAGAAPTALERSPSYRVYADRYEDGKRYLSSATHLPSG